jgi:hypothetical protein
MDDALKQLALEAAYLNGEMARSVFAPLGNWRPPKQWTDTAQTIQRILSSEKLGKLLTIIQIQNRARSCEASENRGGKPAPFLLAPHLFQIVRSVEDRSVILTNMPVLDRPPAEVREHFRDAALKADQLAQLLRKGPHSHVALAARSEATGALIMPLIESSDERARIISLAELLDRAAVSLRSVSISRAGPRRRPAEKKRQAEQEELRHWAAIRLVSLFREKLGHPYHAHVAVVVSLLSGLETDADYVKKAEKRKGTKPPRE